MTDTTKPLDLDAIEQAHREASLTSDGPWSVGEGATYEQEVNMDACVLHESVKYQRSCRLAWADESEARFIVAAHTILPALIAELRTHRARALLPVINECRICKWCVGFGNVNRRTGRFAGTFHCEHPDAPRDVGSDMTSSWSRPMTVDENAAPPRACPLRGRP